VSAAAEGEYRTARPQRQGMPGKHESIPVRRPGRPAQV